MKYDPSTYRITDGNKWPKIPIIFAVIGIIGSVAAALVDPQRFYYSWLVSYTFWFTMAAGGLFFTMMHHLVGATWSVVVRRFSESAMMTLPFFVIGFIVIVMGRHELYHWTQAEAVAHDDLLQWKSPYLNTPFFIIRGFIYFVVWITLAWMLRKKSLLQDKFPEAANSKFLRISAPGMVLFALTITFASFDWLMSLDAHWYSTIFGVYIYSGAVVAILAFVILTVVYLQSKGVMKDCVGTNHYHDLGRLLFAFMVFWGYMAFSQYFLIWYGNIPEETIWFLNRWEGTWRAVSLFLVFGNFGIPFFILITWGAKRKPKFLAVLAFWLIVMHYVDLYWVIMPNLDTTGIHLSWIDVAPFLALGGIFIILFWRSFGSAPVVPVGDPKLESSKNIGH